MAEPLKKDEALAAAVREAFQRHMENARLAAQALKEKQAAEKPSPSPAPSLSRDPRLAVPKPANEPGIVALTTTATEPAPIASEPAPRAIERLVALKEPEAKSSPVATTGDSPVIAPKPKSQSQDDQPATVRKAQSDLSATSSARAKESDGGFSQSLQQLLRDPGQVTPPLPDEDGVSASLEATLAHINDEEFGEALESELSQELTRRPVNDTAKGNDFVLTPEVAVPATSALKTPAPSAAQAETSNGKPAPSSEPAPAIAPKAVPEPAAQPQTPPPSAASPIASGPSPAKAEGQEDTELPFHRPSRERSKAPSLSIAPASVPQDLDELAEAIALAKVSATPASVAKARQEGKAGSSGKKQTIAAPIFSKPMFSKPVLALRKVRLPASFVASVLTSAAILALGAYLWANPDAFRAISSLVSPPNPAKSENQSVTKPESQSAAKPVEGQSQVKTETQVAAVPVTPPHLPAQPATVPASPSPAAAPPSTPPAPITNPASAPSPTTSRSVTTVAITLDGIDEAVQSAREMIVSGDIDGARAALDPYKNSSDPRALFALATVYDPALLPDPAKGEPDRARTYYEAASKAGLQATAERLARFSLMN